MVTPMNRPVAAYDRAAAVQRKQVRDAARPQNAQQQAQPMPRPMAQPPMQAPMQPMPRPMAEAPQYQQNAQDQLVDQAKSSEGFQNPQFRPGMQPPINDYQSWASQPYVGQDMGKFASAPGPYQFQQQQQPQFRPTAGGSTLQNAVNQAAPQSPQGILSRPPKGQYQRVSPGMYRDAQGRLVKR